MWKSRRAVMFVRYMLLVAFAFGFLLSGAVAMPRAEGYAAEGAGSRGVSQAASSTTAILPPAGSVATPATPVSPGQSPSSLAGLRKQGITPAILLAGDLLLLIVALVVVIIERRRRPR